jgi:hypothetical protein
MMIMRGWWCLTMRLLLQCAEVCGIELDAVVVFRLVGSGREKRVLLFQVLRVATCIYYLWRSPQLRMHALIQVVH